MFGFLIAIAAGAVTPIIEDPLVHRIAKSIGQYVEVQDNEVRALAFMIVMMAAGVACNVFDTGSPLGLAVGGTLGYFGARLLRWVQRSIENKRS